MKNSVQLTTAQFAKLHEINKRTLHYYDSIGLFSPIQKGENRYRYYDSMQSMTLEYILMLKELNMSIAEIKAYVSNPNPKDFLNIIEQKTIEIDNQIEHLNHIRYLLQEKKKQIMFCETLPKEIQIISCEEENYLTIPFHFQDGEFENIFSYIKGAWGLKQCRAGVGSYIAVDKVLAGNLDEYDGLFTPALNNSGEMGLIKRPKGIYLCAYFQGIWENLPEMYKNIIDYANVHDLLLTGYAFERGMNDFVISDDNEYITQILIQIKQ